MWEEPFHLKVGKTDGEVEKWTLALNGCFSGEDK